MHSIIIRIMQEEKRVKTLYVFEIYQYFGNQIYYTSTFCLIVLTHI